MKNIFSLFFIFIAFIAHAQIPPSPNCPPASGNNFVHIFGSSHTSCQQPVLLTVAAVNPPMSTDSYSVSTIPYSPYPWVGANQINYILTNDDKWCSPITLPFSFCFFGNQYTQFVASSNGDVGFDITQAMTTNPWNNNPTVAGVNVPWVCPFPNTAINNAIFLHFDYDPSAPTTATTHSNITWDVYGTAPCRALVVSWDSIPLYQCHDSLVSQQIVCYENTNIIDQYVKQKNICPSWQGGIVAQQGLQNVGGTKAIMVPGRNGTTFSLTNDAKRYTPSGPFTYIWFNASANPIGTGANIWVNPLQSTCYNVKATASCSNIVLRDTFCIIVDTPTVAKFTGKVHLGCVHDTIVFTNSSLNAQNYIWDFGDGTGDIVQNPTHVYQTQNIFTVTLIASKPGGCKDTIKKTFDLRHPLKAQMVSIPLNDSLCLGTTYKLTNFSVSAPLISTFNFGDGTIFLMNTVKDTSHLYTQAGLYDFSMKIIDTLGCVDSIKRKIYVDPTPYVNFTVSDTNICLGEPLFFNDSLAYFTQKFIWDFDDNTILTNVHDPMHTYTYTNLPFTVTLTGKYLVCKDSVFKKNIYVYNYPIVSLRSDTSICEGLGTGFDLYNLNDPFGSNGNTLLWNTGSTISPLPVTTAGYYWLKETEPISGCSSTDSVWIKRDCYLNIPNSFTPDGDGLNDYFLPRELLSSGVNSFNMSIFNRWGEEVFKTANIDGRGWDGKFGDKNQPMGTYIYTIKVTFINGTSNTYKGNVTLLR